MSHHDPDTWMWDKARELLERADKLHRRFFQLGRPRSSKPTWEPPIDIFETDDALCIIAALPGVEPARTEIIIDGNVLTIAGERSMPAACQRATVHRLEIPHGRFEREIELPKGRFELSEREMSCGCLFIHLRKLG
jgi:HSP20 family molecular chaperone IbpA